MYKRYRNIKLLQLKATDGAVESELSNYALFDNRANELVRTIEEDAQRKLDYALNENWFLVHSDPEWIKKETEYAELSKNWGKTTTSRACREGPYFHLPKKPVNTTRGTLKTPTPRKLETGWHDRQAMDHHASSSTTAKNEKSLNNEQKNYSAYSSTPTKNEKAFNLTNEGEKDPFYEPGDAPRLLPRGVEPRSYLTTFGYAPPPLLMHAIPQRTTSPSDFGEPLF
ncbi:hypothetical protein N431DRAFT_562220 [Stipitochalara longipes BDJ]|nr:hypothetical protein N431DRAFT_562220 [Stipitochalara longipes BDJ]